MNENRFIFIVPAYNAENTIERMIMSVYMQMYKNYRILIRDDMSTDNTIDKIKETCEQQNIPLTIFSDFGIETINMIENPKVIVWRNEKKYWEVKNCLAMINSEYVNDEDIIVRLDADDFLCDLCALKDINWIYKETKCDALWTANRWDYKFYKNNSGPMPGCYMINYKLDMSEQVDLVQISGEKDVYKHSLNNWNTSHCKTFRKYLINDVNDENFRGKDGAYIRRCGDRALFYPVLHKAKMPVFFPKQTYFYTIKDVPGTYMTDDAFFQKEESDFITKRGFIS